MLVVFYISGHGFGHAARSAELVTALAAQCPAARFIVRTAAPPWLFRASASSVVALEPTETDVGVVQTDSLNLDEGETARRAGAFYRDFDRRADAEAARLREVGAAIVVGDIPPLAHAAAARAGVPSVAVGNFTWDWIYEGYPAFEREAPGVVGTIRAAYALATRVLRLPMHGGFDGLAPITTDIPFIARQSRRNRAETRRVLGIADDRPFVLASFGGYGLDLPFAAIASAERLTVLTVGAQPPAGLAYQDVVAAADAVLTKPGYGIISDCVANGTPLLFTHRGRFKEYDVLVAAMPRLLRCRYVPRGDLIAGRWRAHVDAVLREPPAPEHPRTDGASVAATAILDVLK